MAISAQFFHLLHLPTLVNLPGSQLCPPERPMEEAQIQQRISRVPWPGPLISHTHQQKSPGSAVCPRVVCQWNGSDGICRSSFLFAHDQNYGFVSGTIWGACRPFFLPLWPQNLEMSVKQMWCFPLDQNILRLQKAIAGYRLESEPRQVRSQGGGCNGWHVPTSDMPPILLWWLEWTAITEPSQVLMIFHLHI